jgi:hypothetical protein
METIAAATLLLLCLSAKAPETSTALLQKMYARYHGKWGKTLSFDQTTERYKNDSLASTATWYEHMVYPDKLRIDIGSETSGNFIVFRQDSSYRYKNNKLVSASADENELTFFLGGMYFMPFEDVKAHFTALHYDLSKFHESIWKGKPAYVIGAHTDDEKVNQLWIDKKDLYAVRFIKYDKGMKEEGWFEGQQAEKGGWSETLCTFFINDKKVQVEKYHNLVSGGDVDAGMFDVTKLGK